MLISTALTQLGVAYRKVSLLRTWHYLVHRHGVHGSSQTLDTKIRRPVLIGLTRCLLLNVNRSESHNRSLHLDVTLRSKEGHDQSKEQVSVQRSSGSTSSGLSAAQKVKRAGKDFTYMIVVLIGLGITGGLLYVVFQELFSSSSPSKIYGRAFEKCRSHPEVIGAFGEPIKCYGETTRRGRRQQVSHLEYIKDGLKYMRLKFYIEGSEPGRQGTVHTESKENPETGKYEFRYIFVDVDTYPRRTIVIEDNR